MDKFELTAPVCEPKPFVRVYGSLPSGGVCPCGGHLKYNKWETQVEYRERVTCMACGRTEFASRLR